MSRTIFCIKYQKEMPGLESPPYPGEKGQRIFDQVSAQAWEEWLGQQTMLMNEYRLNPLDKKTKSFLAEEMEKFFAGESQKPEGYQDPS